MKFSVEKQVYLALTSAMLVLVGVSGAAWWDTSRFQAAFRLVDHTHDVLDGLAETMTKLLVLQSDSRGFALTANEKLLRNYAADETALRAAQRRVRRLLADSPAQVQRLDELDPLVDHALALLRQRIAARRVAGLAGVTQTRVNPTGRPTIDLIVDSINAMETEERRLLDLRIARSQSAANATIDVVLVSGGLAVVFASLAGLFLHRELRERRRIEQSLERERAQLRAANAELEAFSYSVSHDLRAPLRHVNGYAGLLEKHAGAALDEKGLRYVRTVRQAAAQMGQLIDDLLAFSRIGRTSLAYAKVDQDALVAATIADGRYESEARAIVWEISPLPPVQADAAMLRQVWANLVDNAVKYSRHAAPARIAISGRLDAGARPEHVFSVRDNGVGFDSAYTDKLFGVFQRLHDATQFEGTGIGLANVRRIVTRHGGRTWAVGEVGKGAEFFFSLPVTPAPSSSS